jgi:Thymidylate kinase
MTGKAEPVGPIVEIAGLDGAGKFRPFTDELHEQLDPIRDRLGQRHVDAARSMAMGLCVLRELSTVTRPTVYDRHLESALMWWSVMDLCPLPAQLVGTLPPPDLVIVLDVDPATAQKRMLRSRIESSEIMRWFSGRCADYLRHHAPRKGWTVLDANQPLETVTRQALAAIRSRLVIAKTG